MVKEEKNYCEVWTGCVSVRNGGRIFPVIMDEITLARKTREEVGKSWELAGETGILHFWIFQEGDLPWNTGSGHSSSGGGRVVGWGLL
jgi:hypothetical protein